jgi:integrase
MALKYSTTTADFLSWEQNLNLIRKLNDDGQVKMSLLISLGSFWGLRISDILNLKWSQIISGETLEVTEKKTGKKRIIKINPQLHQHILECYTQLKPLKEDEFVFMSQKNSVYSVQQINRIFKSIKTKYKLKIKNFSTHSMRKTMGRQVFSQSGENAELSLVKLSQLFNHSSTLITRRYLGISQEELMNTYDMLSF